MSPRHSQTCLTFCALRWKLKPSFAASLTRDAAASHCALALCTPADRYNVHLHTHDAGRALVAALSCPGGIYNVCDDTDPLSHDRFTEATGWRPRQTQ